MKNYTDKKFYQAKFRIFFLLKSMSQDDTFSNIKEIICTTKAVPELLEQDNIVMAVEKEKADALNFLSNHIDEVTDTLFSSPEKITKKMRDNAFKLLKSKLSLKNENVLESVTNKLFAFLQSKSGKSCKEKGTAADEEATNSTSGILHFLIQTTNCGVLSKFKQCKDLLPLLVDSIHHSSISNLLDYLTRSNAQHMNAFLSMVNATDFFVKHAIEHENNREMFLRYIINIISSYPYNEKHYKTFTKDGNFKAIFEIAFSESVNVSSLAFYLIDLILDFSVFIDDDEKESNKLYRAVVPTTLEMMPRIIEFILKDDKFLLNRKSCVSAIISFSNVSSIDLTKDFTTICVYLFGLMKKNPIHTMLHQSFLDILRYFKKPGRTPQLFDLLEKLGMKDAILDAYSTRMPNRMFYYEFTSFVFQCETQKKLSCSSEEKWNNFINTVYNEIKEIISKSYGGKIDFKSDDDSFFEEIDDKEAPYDNSARSYAEKIFGAKYLMDEEEDFCDEEDDELDNDNDAEKGKEEEEEIADKDDQKKEGDDSDEYYSDEDL